MSCPMVEAAAAPGGIEAMRDSAECGLQEPLRTLEELRETLHQAIFQLRLYNFDVGDESSNPPLPQMTSQGQNSNSYDIFLPSRNDAYDGQALTNQYVIRNRMNCESLGDTTPIEQLGLIKGGGHTCYSGPAGSGKTTLLRMIARNSIKGSNGYTKIETVHMINSHPFQVNKECYAWEAIFSSDIVNPEDKFKMEESKLLFDRLCSNPEKFLLIFDSLDTLPQELSEVKIRDQDYHRDRQYHPMVHLKMLISGKLLKGHRVVTSSRPHAIRNLNSGSMYHVFRVVTLLGFSEKDTLEVLKLYSPNNADKIFETIKKKSHLFSLFKEPVFLVFLVKIWTTLRNLDYMRMTDVLTEVVNCFRESEHAQVNYNDKLKEIQKLARGSLWRRIFDFDETTIKEYGLEISDLTDLCRDASDENGKPLMLKLTTGESPFMFSHQSVQEMLAAKNVIESKYPKFEEKISVIHEPFFHKTRDFVYGLAFERKGLVGSVFPSIDKKRAVLKKSIEERFRQVKNSQWEQLSIFETLTEAISKEERFKLEIEQGVNLSGIPMNDWSLYCTGIVISQSTHFTALQFLHLEGCAIQLSHMRALEVGIRRFNGGKFQILSLSLRGNPGIGVEKEAVEIACRIVRKCNVHEFNLGSCGLNSDSISEMFDGLRETKLASLNLAGNNMGEEGMRIAGDIVKCCSIKEIFLTGCATRFEDVEAFGRSAKGANIHGLVAYDRNGMVLSWYGNVIRLCQIEVLQILLNSLRPEDALRLAEYSADGKLNELQLLYEEVLSFGPRGLTSAANNTEHFIDTIRYLLPLVRKRLTMLFNVSGSAVEKLQTLLDSLPDEGPVIKFQRLGTPAKCTLMSKKRQNPSGQGGHVDETKSTASVAGYVADEANSQAEEGRNSCDDEETIEEKNIAAASVGQATEEVTEEIWTEIEDEYLNITSGRDIIAWLQKWKSHRVVISEILETYGLSIHGYEMEAEDCHLVAETLSECSKLNMFNFAYSEGLGTLLDALQKAKSIPTASKVSFAGYPGIGKELSDQFVTYVKLFEAEGLVLTSVNASHDGLLCLRNDLQTVKQAGHFKSLGFFHNSDIDEKGWECLAEIATDFSNVPLSLATCYCDVDNGRLSAFKKALKSTQLGKVDICGSRKLNEEGFQTLGEIVRTSGFPSVTLQDCDLDVAKVRSFNSGCGMESLNKVHKSEQIESLNVANNPNLGPDGIEEIKKTIRYFCVKNLNIGSCRLDHVDFDRSFESLDISGNPQCHVIPEIAKSVGKRLYVRNCMLSKSELERLALILKSNKQKLTEIDVSESSKEIECDDVDYLVEIFKDVTDDITVAANVTISTS